MDFVRLFFCILSIKYISKVTVFASWPLTYRGLHQNFGADVLINGSMKMLIFMINYSR